MQLQMRKHSLIEPRVALEDILKDGWTIVRDVGKELGAVTKDTTSVMVTGVKDFLRVLRQVASSAETILVKASVAIVHNIEADASFVASHGMQIAEAATLAFLPIQFIGAALVSGAIIYAGATINPNYSNPNRSTNQLSR